MEFDLKEALKALLLSTTEPIDCSKLVKIFACHRSQVKEAIEAEHSSERDLVSVPPAVTQKQISEALTTLMDTTHANYANG